MYSKRILFYLRGKKKKKKKKKRRRRRRDGKRGGLMREKERKEFDLVNGLIIFNFFIKRSFNDVTKKLNWYK